MEVRRRIGSMNLVVRLVPQVETASTQINLSFEDWRFLTLVDGKHDLTTLAASSPEASRLTAPPSTRP